jgi:hypothetical protein
MMTANDQTFRSGPPVYLYQRSSTTGAAGVDVHERAAFAGRLLPPMRKAI